MLAVSVDDVVDKKYPAVAERVDVAQNFFRWPEAVSASRCAADRAKFAIERAATAGFEGAREQVALVLEQVAAGNTVTFHVKQLAGPIPRLQLAPFEIRNQLGPDGFCFAHDDGVGMSLGFVRTHR